MALKFGRIYSNDFNTDLNIRRAVQADPSLQGQANVYQDPARNVQAAPPQQQQPQGNGFWDKIGSLWNGASDVATMPINAARLGVANLTGNKAAADSARNQFEQNVQGAQPFTDLPAKAINTTSAISQAVQNLGKTGVQSVFGSDKSYQQARNNLDNSVSTLTDPTYGVNQAGTFFQGSMKKIASPNAGIGDIAKGSAITGGQLAPYFIGGSGGGPIQEMLAGGSSAGIASAAQQYGDTGKVDTGQTVMDAILGAGQAGVMHGAKAMMERPQVSLKGPVSDSMYAEGAIGQDVPASYTNPKGKPKVSSKTNMDAAYKNVFGEDRPAPVPETPPSTKELAGVTTKTKGANKPIDNMQAMHDALNAGASVDEVINDYIGKNPGATMGEAQGMVKKVLGVNSLDRSVVNSKLNPEYGKHGLGAVTEGDTKQPVLNSRAIQQGVIERGNKALDAVTGLSEKDLALMDKIRGNDPKVLSKQAENPQQFIEAAQKVKEYNDYTHAVGAGTLGQQVPYRQNYGAPMLFEQPTTDVQAARSVAMANDPSYGKARNFNSYDHAAQYDLTRRYENFAQDLAHDIQTRSSNLSQLALQQSLEKAFPGQVRVGDIGASEGGIWKQLQIPGGSKLSMPAEIADQINKRALATPTKGALAAYDKLNGHLKYLKLGGGAFHGMTTAGTVAGQQLTSGNLFMHPLENLRTIAGTLSQKVHEANMAGYAERGVTEKARTFGVTLTPESILGDVKSSFLDKIPVLKQLHEAVFGRQIPEAKLMIFEQNTRGLDPNIPEDAAKMRQVASAVNNLGGINRAVEGLTPQTAQRLSRAVLATDFTEAKFRTLSNALSKGGPEGRIARQMVVGKTIVFMLPGLAAATAAGKIDWNDPKDVAKNITDQILDPSIATPFKGKSGIARVAKTPETFISELGRIVKPMFDGSADPLSGASHYAIARLAALPSLAVQMKTNQDYAGNPVIQQNPDGSLNVAQTATNFGTNSLPIPIAQGIKAAQGKQAWGEAAINTAGFRMAADPNDPQMQAFNLQQKLVKGLNAEDKAKWESVYGKKADQYGNPITNIGLLDSQEKAQILLTNPEILAVGTQVNDLKKQLGLPSDPFFELPSDKQKTILNLAIDKFRNPTERKVIQQQNDAWLKPYYAARSAYFDQLNLPPSNKTADVPEPQAPATMATYAKITDPKAKSQYLAEHPELSDYFTAHDNYIRQGRAAQNLPQYDKYPTAPPDVKKLMDTYNALPKGEANGKSRIRSAWIKAHPTEWAKITDQYNKQSTYGLQQDASQAAFEGQDMTEKGIKDIVSLAKGMGLTSNGSGYSKGYSRKTSFRALPTGAGLRTGGSFKAPTVKKVSVSRVGQGRPAKVASAKPKVALKKSKV